MLIAAGLATKASFLAFVPLPLLAATISPRARRWVRTPVVSLSEGIMLAATAALVPLAAWWYARPMASGGASLVSLFNHGGEPRPIGPIGYLLHNHWIGQYGRVLFRYWGARLDTLPGQPPSLPMALLAGLSVTCLVAAGVNAAAIIRRHLRRRRRTNRGLDPGHPRDPRLPPTAVMVILAAATVTTAAFYNYLDYRLTADLGGYFVIRGQYFLPPILGQMTWLLVAAMLIFPQ